MAESYYTKKTVYGNSPLKEVIYELEDAVEYDNFSDIEFVPKEKLKLILERHHNTVKEFKKKLRELVN